jgi:Tol biopolymer transport system component
MKSKLIFAAAALAMCLVACEKKECLSSSTCFDICENLSSPISTPIWHPVKNIIGFNWVENSTHYPQSSNDSIGFWIVNENGTNAHKILPYNLSYPSWTMDGENLLFTNSNGVICSMPFDGEKFDVDKIKSFGINGYGAIMNKKENKIAYMENRDSINGEAVYVYDINNQVCEYIGKSNNIVSWSLGGDTLMYIFNDKIYAYDCSTHLSSLFHKFNEQFSSCSPVHFSPNHKDLSFVALYNDEIGRFLFNTNEEHTTRLTTNGYCSNFSYSQDGQWLVYVQNIDEYQNETTTPTAWIVNIVSGNRRSMLNFE